MSNGWLFDAVVIDPPWKLSGNNPTWGVKINYSSLSDWQIKTIKVDCLQTDGFIFMWAINSKIIQTLRLLEEWGYDVVDEI